jgi:hypothetical protein
VSVPLVYYERERNGSERSSSKLPSKRKLASPNEGAPPPDRRRLALESPHAAAAP